MTPAGTLERNLKALGRTSPDAAQLIARTSPRDDVEFHGTEDGVLSASAGGRALASRRRPRAEAERLIEQVDLKASGGIVVLGFGVGHHVAELAQRLRRTGVIVVYEPDVALLRAIFERIDHSEWMAEATLIVLTDPDDAGALAGAVRGYEGVLALGVKIVEHPPSAPRLGEGGQRFVDALTRMVRSMRTTVVTTLVQVETTMRNQLCNLADYALRPGVAELAGIGEGRPAIIVAAGPSLHRTIRLLEDESLRERAVIIGVQTVLKPLLERGIRPHFVTALDYHAISRRFYEGLTPEDVEGVTLIAEAKANPAILRAFPGEIRCPRDRFLDDVLGEQQARDRGRLEAGATVAHLAYYLARHLGCDPVILTGQDLAFTDGQYYASGAAIHQVWSGELGEFNTLDMMEWQRIVRGRKTLRRAADIHGRPVYTDEQMHSYLVQFERDFAADDARGLRTIDATEGGVKKNHTTVMPLADAIDEYAPAHAGEFVLPPGASIDEAAVLKHVRDRLRDIRRDVARVRTGSGEARRLLEHMLEAHGNAQKVNELIEQVQRLDEQVKSLSPAFRMVQHLNQTGTLNRYKADRNIELEASTPLERQQGQIKRDIANVTWLGQAAEELEDMLRSAGRVLAGDEPQDKSHVPRAQANVPRGRICALMCVDPDFDALGRPRPLYEPLIGGENALQCVLRRLARCRRIKEAVLLTHEPKKVRKIIGPEPPLPVHVEPVREHPLRARRACIQGARAWADSSWRGGLASMTCYDELLAPTPMHEVMVARGIDAVILVGADWALFDPAIARAVIDRHAERPDSHRLVFSQAPPGLGACLIERSLMGELCEKSVEAGVFASVGALVGYVPIMPKADPIARPVCVDIDPIVRDAHVRFVADGPMRERIARLPELATASSVEAMRAIQADMDVHPDVHPTRLFLELAADGHAMDVQLARHILEPLRNLGIPITLSERAGPVERDHLCEIITLAAEVGPVHLRTHLRVQADTLDRLIDSPASVISADLVANNAETYRTLTGVDAFDQVRANVEHLLARRRTPEGPDTLPTPWVVPRITRRDATYEQIEPFFDCWIMRAGAAIIDPPPGQIEGERIQPCAHPPLLAARIARTSMTILADGSVPLEHENFGPNGIVADVRESSVETAWRTLLGARRARFAPEHDDAFCTPAPCA